MAVSTSRIDIEEEIVRIFAKRDDTASMMPTKGRTTAAGAAAGTLTDTRLGMGTIRDNKFNGRIIKIAEDVTAAFGNPASVNGAHNATVTTLAVDDAQDIIPGYVILVDGSEKMLVTGKATNDLTVVRGYAGTTAAAYTDAETVVFCFLGHITAVDDAGLAAGGVLTVSPDFPMNCPMGLDYLLYPKGLIPETITEGINLVLRSSEAIHLWAPSLVDDSDFDAELLTNWAAVGTPTTREFSTTAAYVRLGERALKLVTDATGEGATSNTFNVHENENLLVSAHLSVTGGDAHVVLYRETATAANIKASGTLDDDAWTEARFSESVPADCEQATVKFLSVDTASSTFYVSPHIIVQSDRQRAYVAPSWLVNDAQVLGAMYLPAGANAEADDAFVSLGSAFKGLLGLEMIRSDRDLNPIHLHFRNGLARGPVYLACKRPFAELAYDSLTTHCDREYLVKKTVANILKDRGDGEWRQWAREAAARAETMRYGGRESHTEERTTLV